MGEPRGGESRALLRGLRPGPLVALDLAQHRLLGFLAGGGVLGLGVVVARHPQRV